MRRAARRVRGLRIVGRLPPTGPGFLRLERFRARNLYAGGGESPSYRFEVVHRRTVDAVAIIPFFRREGRLWVVLKEGFRPGLYLRHRLRLAVRDRRAYTLFREAVAGSLERGDRGERGIDRRARAELLEETGFGPADGRILRLGAGFFPSHGQSTEKVHLRAARIDPGRGIRPPGDGSVNEGDSGTLAMEAGAVLRACQAGRIEDPKLEIGVTRLCRRLGYRVR